MNKTILHALELISLGTLLATPLVLAATPNHQQVQKLLGSDGTDRDSLGYSVAVSGDTAVVGAPQDSASGDRSGSAYVYTRGASGVWTEQAKLLARDGAPLDGFGWSVAVSGDTALIGAVGDDDNGNNNGSVYVYTRNGSEGWTEQAKLLASDGAEGPPPGDEFGWSVAVSGSTAVIGAPGDADNGQVSGSAYVYTRDASGVWSEQAKLLASDGTAGDLLGGSVSVSGETTLIGAVQDGRNGAAYVYMRDASGIWSEQSKLLADDGAPGDAFGGSVSVSGDAALIGAVGDDDNSDRSGSAYVYTRDASGVWSEQAKLRASDGAPFELFGREVALSSDTALIGAPFSSNGSERGSVYMFRRDGSGVWTERAKLLASDGTADDHLGWSIAVSGDTALIGAPGDDDKGFDSGSAYVFGLDTSPLSASLQCPGDINGDGVADLVLVTQTGRVRVKDVTGAWVNGFDLPGETGVIDTELMADINTNGAPELVLLESGDAGAQVRDLLTGATLGSVAIARNSSPADLEILPDQTGNGIPELAMLGRGLARVQVRDALTGAGISSVTFANYVVPQDLEVYPAPDASGNGWPDLAVLGDNRVPEHADLLEIRHPASGAIARQIWLGRGWRVHQQRLLGDLNGNGSHEVAVLREHVATSRVNVWVRDTATAEWVNFIGFPREYVPQNLLSLPDLNGNGADEVAVFGRRVNGRDQKVVIKDSRTGQQLNVMWFDKNFPGQDLVSCGDVNGNGAQEVAFLGQRLSDGRYKVIFKDSRTGERLAMVWWF